LVSAFKNNTTGGAGTYTKNVATSAWTKQ
jgi:hypothetical protein